MFANTPVFANEKKLFRLVLAIRSECHRQFGTNARSPELLTGDERGSMFNARVRDWFEKCLPYDVGIKTAPLLKRHARGACLLDLGIPPLHPSNSPLASCSPPGNLRVSVWPPAAQRT
jgi:hypothetical protein